MTAAEVVPTARRGAVFGIVAATGTLPGLVAATGTLPELVAPFLTGHLVDAADTAACGCTSGRAMPRGA